MRRMGRGGVLLKDVPPTYSLGLRHWDDFGVEDVAVDIGIHLLAVGEKVDTLT